MSERSKEHAWKVCIPQKGIVGSNPTLSAECIQIIKNGSKYSDFEPFSFFTIRLTPIETRRNS